MKGKKTGGRQKGTPNKKTGEEKAFIRDIVEDYHNNGSMAKDLKAIEDPKDRLDIYLKLMSFIYPKPQAVAVDINSVKSKTIEETLIALAQENE